jgi:hypothetical protein
VDAFDYPLTQAEIHRYLIRLPLSSETVNDSLNRGGLVPQRLRRSGEYYTLPGRESMMHVRRQREAVAQRLWPEAARYGRLIARMPFVRMVAVTGSLAVNNVGPDEDIDYLTVTADDHLWVCRAFVILVVRWAARRGVKLCPNYFLTERSLQLSAKNLYTAHEVTQMVPLFGLSIYQTLRRVNPWTYHYLPNARGAPELPTYVRSILRNSDKPPGRRLAETVFNNRHGRRLDEWEMARKVRKFRQTHDGWQEAEFSADTCKGHFNLHQQRTIEAYERLVGDNIRGDTIENGSAGAEDVENLTESALNIPT